MWRMAEAELSPEQQPIVYQNLQFITTRRQELRKSEIKVADYVIGNPQKVVHYSISELADNADVSEPTVIRFCRRIGFRGYQDFKIALAQSVVPRIKNIHEAIGESDNAQTLAVKIFQANVEAIQDSLQSLDFSALEQTIEACTTAGTIVFFGLGGSASVAMDAYHKFFRLGIPCNWYEDTHMQAMGASMLGPDDVVIAVSHSGSSKDIVEAIEIANEAGALTVAITSHVKSPVSRAARILLSVSTTETSYRFEPMASRIAHLSVIDTIAVGVSMRRQEQYVESVRRTRRALVKKRY